MRMTRTTLFTIMAGFLVVAPLAGQMESHETSVTVRVLARDAKLLGDAVGGARITISQVETGAVLASGVTSGGTGDTQAIMKRRRTKGEGVFASPGAAGWRARFHLSRPTLVRIVAEGPLAFPDASVRAEKTMLLTPGTDLGDDGIVLELNGLIVEALEPQAGRAGPVVAVRARVRMLCSCPTEPGGLWSVERVSARLLDEGEAVAVSELGFSGETSIYAGEVRAPGPGRYTLEILAEDPATANFGRTATIVTVGGGGADARRAPARRRP